MAISTQQVVVQPTGKTGIQTESVSVGNAQLVSAVWAAYKRDTGAYVPSAPNVMLVYQDQQSVQVIYNATNYNNSNLDIVVSIAKETA